MSVPSGSTAVYVVTGSVLFSAYLMRPLASCAWRIPPDSSSQRPRAAVANSASKGSAVRPLRRRGDKMASPVRLGEGGVATPARRESRVRRNAWIMLKSSSSQGAATPPSTSISLCLRSCVEDSIHSVWEAVNPTGCVMSVESDPPPQPRSAATPDGRRSRAAPGRKPSSAAGGAAGWRKHGDSMGWRGEDMEKKRRHSCSARSLRQRAAVIDDAMGPMDARTQEHADAPTPEPGGMESTTRARGGEAGTRTRTPVGT